MVERLVRKRVWVKFSHVVPNGRKRSTARNQSPAGLSDVIRNALKKTRKWTNKWIKLSGLTRTREGVKFVTPSVNVRQTTRKAAGLRQSIRAGSAQRLRDSDRSSGLVRDVPKSFRAPGDDGKTLSCSEANRAILPMGTGGAPLRAP